MILFLDYPDHVPIARTPLTLRPGLNQASVTLPKLYGLTVLGEFGEPATRFRIGPAGERHSWIVKPVGADGKAVFEDLPAGTYTLTSWEGREPGAMTVAVPEPSVVRFQPKPFNALRVVLYNPNGYLPTLGFRTGDLVVGVNGSEFEGFPQIQRFFKLRSKATLLVQRGAERLEIRTDLAELLRSGDDFEPACR